MNSHKKLFDNHCFRLSLNLQGIHMTPDTCKVDFKNTRKETQWPASLTYNITNMKGINFGITFEDKNAISLQQFISQFKEDRKIELTLLYILKSKGINKDICKMILEQIPLLTPKICEKYLRQMIGIIDDRVESTQIIPLEKLIMFKRGANGLISGVDILDITKLKGAVFLDKSDLKSMAPEVKGGKFGPKSDVWEIGNIIEILTKSECLKCSNGLWQTIADECHKKNMKDRPTIRRLREQLEKDSPYNAKEEKTQTPRK